nr:MAG: replication associated protein [Cressdnaviricota sp.]
MPRAKFWVFTSYQLETPNWDPAKCKYLTFQLETCPLTNRNHYQGYVELRRSSGITEVKEVLGSTQIHVEPSRSEAAIAYCHKEDTRLDGPWEFGKRGSGVRRGEREDINEFAESLVAGNKLRDVAIKYPGTFLKYSTGAGRLANIIIPERDINERPHIEVYIGVSGSGKSRSVYTKYGADSFYKKDGTTKWWDGYSGQKIIFLDEWVGSQEISPVSLLQICDWWPLTVETKRGHVPLTAKHIIITTTQHWGYWYKGTRWEVLWAEKSVDFQRRMDDFGTLIRTEDT